MVKVCPPGVLPTLVLKPLGNGQREECSPLTLTEACLALRGAGGQLLVIWEQIWDGLGPSCYHPTPPSHISVG